MITDYGKQVELIEVEKVNTPIHVIGSGATGSWIVHMLLKMGFKDINVYDFDKIEEHNLPNQCFNEHDIGKYKVNALYEQYKRDYNDQEDRLKVNIKKVDVTNCMTLDGIVLCCVDSMDSRKELYKYTYKLGEASAFIECRIGLYGAYIYTLTDHNAEKLEKYEKTIYADEDVEKSVCGVSQTALPAAISCASTVIMQMIKVIKKEDDIINEVRYQLPDYLTLNNTF